jgi:alkanesulfonate monooxygenase SsuD/methylene tetrahydromethanopterin reductase-like flavin-dependent oxidoreductase (luciferase family)
MVPVPGVYLGAVARATKRMRLGPLVYLLPLYSPLHLIEEICMLDHLSHGRLEVGIGRGVSGMACLAASAGAAGFVACAMQAPEPNSTTTAEKIMVRRASWKPPWLAHRRAKMPGELIDPNRFVQL